MVEELPAITDADVRSLAQKLADFNTSLTDAERALLRAALAPTASDVEVQGYADGVGALSFFAQATTKTEQMYAALAGVVKPLNEMRSAPVKGLL
jgi:hypothetical protein